jgi:nucleotide-binding universal stress UspA family protein
VLTGKPAAEILQYADENDVSLIAMASRGGSYAGPTEETWLLGNIASKVVQVAGKPVLLIRDQAKSTAIAQKRLIKKIMVPLDGSKAGEAALPHVERLAQIFDAQVILFHVLELAPVPILMAPGIQFPYPPTTPDQEARRAVSGLAYLEGVEKALAEKGIDCSSETSSGSPALEIVNYAEANAIDLIAISTHGRSGIGRWVFGSVTERLLQTGSTPVLTVRERRG